MPKTKFLKREIDQLKSFTREENLRIISHINNIKKKDCCCILDCPKTDLLIFYCKSCKKSNFICSSDFRGRTKSRICPVCSTKSITRRYAHRIN